MARVVKTSGQWRPQACVCSREASVQKSPHEFQKESSFCTCTVCLLSLLPSDRIPSGHPHESPKESKVQIKDKDRMNWIQNLGGENIHSLNLACSPDTQVKKVS
jgi:hypothetical protein